MKGYAVPSMILLFLAGLALLGALYTVGLEQTASRILASRQSSLEAQKTQLQTAKANVAKAKTGAVPIESFIDAWRDQFKAADDLSQIFGKLDALAINNLLASSEKKNLPNAGYPFRGKAESVLRVDMKVSGEYWRILQWLGQVEGAYPLARVESVAFTVTNNTIGMQTVLIFPRFKEFTDEKGADR